jgi:hypothetical protein
VDAEGEEFGGFKEVELAFEKEGVGAEIDVFFAGDEALDDFIDLRMNEGFAAGDGNHGGTALVSRRPALFRSEAFAENVIGILDFTAAGAGEVATKEGLEHENERVALVAAEFLPEDIRSDGPSLADGNWHMGSGKATNPDRYVNGTRTLSTAF